MLQAILENIGSQWELFVRLVLACACGAVIGLERSHRRKDAGIKTHIILAMGSALFIIISQYAFADIALSEAYRADISRIASNIVTGVSFLCAGVIFVRGGAIKGLTTATGIWTTAGIGMAAGAGMYAITVFATLLILSIQLLFHKKSKEFESHCTVDFTFALSKDQNIDEKVTCIADLLQSEPNDIKVFRNEDGSLVLKLRVYVLYHLDKEKMFETLKNDPDIKDISIGY